MTDIIVHNLSTEQKVRIRCRDYIRKIAIWKDKLAVLLPDRTIVYTLSTEENSDMNYKMHCKINKKLECTFFGVVSSHIICASEQKIVLIS